MFFLTMIGIIFFCRLGFWQIDRAHEKNQMLAQQHKFTHQQPLRWQSSLGNPQQYQPITLRGVFLSETFLLDNQHYQHQLGYDVLSPFQLNDGAVILVDRGWLASSGSRLSSLGIKTPKGELVLNGVAYYPLLNRWILSNSFEKNTDGVVIVEQIDVKSIGIFLHKSLFPFIMRLSNEDNYGFVRDWPIVSMSPARHYAYAFQWFAIALTILIIFIALNFKKNDTK